MGFANVDWMLTNEAVASLELVTALSCPSYPLICDAPNMPIKDCTSYMLADRFFQLGWEFETVKDKKALLEKPAAKADANSPKP